MTEGSGSNVTISIIVPAFNEEKLIERSLQNKCADRIFAGWLAT